MIDFSNFGKPDQKNRPTDPREIFKRRPSGEGAANDLWQGQAEALSIWFDGDKSDSLILLNTGAGKTIIGLLIAQSYLNQGIRNVVYACGTIDLVYQTAREASKLGVPVSLRIEGKFDNELFNQGRAFCITTYQAVLNARSTFRGALRPGAIIFDDAHVANRLIRDSFTLQISKENKAALYSEIIEAVRPIFVEFGQKMELLSVLREDSLGSVLLVPPCGFFDIADKVTGVIDGSISDKEASLYFPWLFLRDHLKFCACFVRNDSIEFAPPFLPTQILQAFAPDVRRVYLSATITTNADFTRVFGRAPKDTIAPDVDAGDGERLFLFGSKLGNREAVTNLLSHVLKKTKALIAVPSRARGQRWSDVAILPTRENFTEKLNEFRQAKTGGFVLAGRFDGIDLPGSQCRVMAIDGLPTGVNLIEQYLFDQLQMDHFMANTVSVRLTQLLGRIIRGRQDFGFFAIADQHTENWLKNERNRSLLPPLIRRQLFLSEQIENQISGAIDEKSALEMGAKVLNRAQDWIEFYRDNINDFDVSGDRLKENAEEDTVLAEAGKREVWFMTKLWDNDPQGAWEALEPSIKDVAIFDPVLAGWYSVWVGMAYYANGNTDAAIDHFDEARRRIGRSLPLPRRRIAETERVESVKTFIEDGLRQAATGAVGKINERISKLRAATKDAFLTTATHKQAEEAVRIIGSGLGFASSRPCSDYGKGPDNLWIDPITKQMIAFELKTDKKPDSMINKDDLGQGLNHIEWLKSQHENLELIGLIFLSDAKQISEKGSPSDIMYLGSQAKLREVWDNFLANVERIRPKTQLERYIEATKIGELPEWSCGGILKRLADKKMK
jgi:type III restriction/modification enzyme restriction subunit/RAD3-like DEAD/DEAH box helicase